ncbi:MAG: aldo/keto reductase [Fimbriimonas sp.]|nr:aldo/keto reductase [Fimbriimonas sp.]
MKYGKVPHLDKPVSRIVFGVISLPTNDNAKAFALLDAYRAIGGNAIDNSYVYGPGFAAVLRAYYEKYGEDALIRFDKGNHHSANNDEGRRVTKEAMDHDLRGNLERYGVSYSDFYVLHRDDRRVPAGEVVEWLNEHLAAGRVKAFGGSNWHHTRIAEANEYAEKHGLQGFSASSPNLCLATANEPMWWEAYQVDREGRDWYEQTGFPLFAWSSAGGGFFAEIDNDSVRRVYHNETNFARLERAKSLASEKGTTVPKIALAWTLNQPLNVWALAGMNTLDQVRQNAEALEIVLTQEELDYLEHGSQPA